MDITQVIASICFFIGTPTVILSFIYLMKKSKNNVELARYKNEIMKLEIENSKIRLELLEEENKKYDRLINEK